MSLDLSHHHYHSWWTKYDKILIQGGILQVCRSLVRFVWGFDQIWQDEHGTTNWRWPCGWCWLGGKIMAKEGPPSHRLPPGKEWFQGVGFFSTLEKSTKRGGFLKYVWNFHPESWGRWTHFDDHIFQRGWNHQLDWHFEPKDHPIEKEHHLPSTSMTLGSMFEGVSMHCHYDHLLANTNGGGGESPKTGPQCSLDFGCFQGCERRTNFRCSRYKFGKVILIQEVYETTNKWVYGSTHAQLYKHGIRFRHPYSSCVVGLGPAGFGFG